MECKHRKLDYRKLIENGSTKVLRKEHAVCRGANHEGMKGVGYEAKRYPEPAKAGASPP